MILSAILNFSKTTKLISKPIGQVQFVVFLKIYKLVLTTPNCMRNHFVTCQYNVHDKTSQRVKSDVNLHTCYNFALERMHFFFSQSDV